VLASAEVAHHAADVTLLVESHDGVDTRDLADAAEVVDLRSCSMHA
jgi:hypothetical protein